MDGSAEFDEFVAARSARLLRTSYLLTRDHALAEDVLQTALTKAWFAWSRIDGDPEPYVRKIIVNTYSSCSVGTVKSQASKALAKLRVDPALDPTERRDATDEGGAR